MIINIFCVFEDRKLLLPFQRTKDLNKFRITISKGHFWQQTLQKLPHFDLFLTSIISELEMKNQLDLILFNF